MKYSERKISQCILPSTLITENVRKQPTNMFLEKQQRILKMAINKMSKIHASDNILVIVKELVFNHHSKRTKQLVNT